MAKNALAVGSRQVANLSLTGKERFLAENDIIVSKTDPKGIITYVNDIFQDISDYTEREMLGQQHSVIRHPHMPRIVFKVLWDTIKSGNEVFAYVMNRCKNGDHYWVLAHVTPSYTLQGELVGYHSNRRAPKKAALAVIQPLYRSLAELEAQDRKAGLEASAAALDDLLRSKKLSYEEFVFSL